MTIIASGINISRTDKTSHKYGTAAIEVLNNYKNGNFSEEEAEKQIRSLREKINNEIRRKENSFTENERHKLSTLESKLYFFRSMSIVDVNDLIEEIQELIN